MGPGHDDEAPTDLVLRVDGDFVARRSPAAVDVAIGPGAVVFDPALPVQVPLNETATLVWACLDGRSSLGAIAAELSDAIGLPRKAVTDDVIRVVAHFAALGIVSDAKGNRIPVLSPKPPAPLLDSDFPSGDSGAVAVRVGVDAIGVRSNVVELVDRLREVLAPSLAREPARPRLSMLVRPTRGRIPELCHLYRDDELVLSTTSRGRLLSDTIAYLDWFASPPPGLVRLNAHALVGKKGTILVGGAFREILDLAANRLHRAGFRILSPPLVFADRTDFDLVVTRRQVETDLRQMEALDAEYPLVKNKCPSVGRYPITQLLMVGSRPDDAKVASAPQRAVALLPMLRDLNTRVHPRDVEWLAGLDERTPTTWIFGTDDSELLEALDRLGGRLRRPPIALPR